MDWLYAAKWMGAQFTIGVLAYLVMRVWRVLP